MSCGAVIIASATPPVQEVVSKAKTDYRWTFRSTSLADSIAAVLTSPKRFEPLAKAARLTVQENYDLNNICLPRQMELVERLLGTLRGYR